MVDIEDLRAMARARAWRQHGRKFWIWLGIGAVGFAVTGIFGAVPTVIVLFVVLVAMVIIHRRHNRDYRAALEGICAEIDKNDAPMLVVTDNYMDATKSGV